MTQALLYMQPFFDTFMGVAVVTYMFLSATKMLDFIDSTIQSKPTSIKGS